MKYAEVSWNSNYNDSLMWLLVTLIAYERRYGRVVPKQFPLMLDAADFNL